MFCYYYSFKGIPYAAPPVGDLRFRPPRPHPGWKSIRPANQFGPSCPQMAFGIFPTGHEDCLFLNVYSADLNESKAVMVFIHGGSFLDGSADMYGPDYLVQDGVVLVTFNYRLNILGFMSTGDKHAPGNYGMKDMVEALKWVQQNIAEFGGDPNNVTLFGESSGAAAVHYLILSEMTNGLFHKAIAQSGTILCPWAFNPNPLKTTLALAKSLNIPTTSTEQIVDKLKNMPISQLLSTIGEPESPYGMRPFDYTPVVEPADSEDPILLSAKPFDILRSGNFNKVPLIMGYNDAEALYKIHSPYPDNTDMNYVPLLWNIPHNSTEEAEVAQAFRNFYWRGSQLDDNLRYQYLQVSIIFSIELPLTILILISSSLQYATDHVFAYGIDKCIKIHTKYQKEPVYLYKFEFDGDLNGFKILFDLGMYPGATHADDLFYIFATNMLPPVFPNNPAFQMRTKMVRLWTNFAKYGDPTYRMDDLIDVKWQPVQGEGEYLNISLALTPDLYPEIDRMTLWNKLEQRYANFD